MTHEAEVEYSETVMKARERFESEVAEACVKRIRVVRPAHRAYNAAVIAAERSVPLVPASRAARRHSFDPRIGPNVPPHEVLKAAE